MKRFARFIAPIVLSAAVLLPSAAFAYNVKGGASIPDSLTLTKESALYNVDGSGPSGASLAPQKVAVIGYRFNPPAGNMNVSFIVDTWLGPKFVNEFGATLNFTTSDLYGKTVELKKTTALYDKQDYTSKIEWASLAPQSVKIGRGGNGTYVEIETFIGLKWIDIRDFQ